MAISTRVITIVDDGIFNRCRLEGFENSQCNGATEDNQDVSLCVDACLFLAG
jgi:hypothetical protein